MNDVNDLFIKLARNLEKFKSLDGKPVVVDGKRIGPGIANRENMVKGTKVSKNSEQAIIQEKYEQSKLGQLKGEVSDRELEGIVERYVEDLVGDILKDI